MARRIAYVLENLHYGGVERHLIEILKRLDRRRYEPRVFCRGDGGPLTEEIRSLDTPVHVYDIQYAYNWKGIRGEFRLMRDLRSFAPDLISYYMSGMYIPEVLAGLAAGCRNLIFNHHNVYRDWPARYYHFARWMEPCFKMSIACSHDTERFLIRHRLAHPDRLRVYYNGLDFAPFQEAVDAGAVRESIGVGRDEFVVGTVARMAYFKRQIDGVEAMGVLRDQGRKVRYVVAGDGEMMPKIRQRVAELRLKKEVLLLGSRPDGPRLVKAFDAAIFPSDLEANPIAIIEAMLSGIPVIGAEAPGTSEIVKDGENGLIVPVGDHAAMAAAIARYQDSPELARSMAANAKAFAERTFSIDTMMEAFMGIYDEVTSDE